MAGYDYVLLDGTLIETDRVATPGPTAGVDLWWSKKHKNHGGNIQVLTAPDGWPLWTSPVRPGREHDTTCLRTHPDLLPTLAAVRGDLRTLTDLGYEGEADTVVVAFKKPKNGELTDLQQTLNRAHNRLRAVGERGNSLLKVTFKALRNIGLDPWRIGAIAAAGHAQVLAQVRSCRWPGSAAEVQIGRPSGRMTAWMFAPKSRCLPEHQASMVLPLTLIVVPVSRSLSNSFPSRMTYDQPSSATRRSAVCRSWARAASTAMLSSR
jgi:hypothetical protein